MVGFISSTAFREVGNRREVENQNVRLAKLHADLAELYSSKVADIFRDTREGLEGIASDGIKADKFLSGLILGPSEVVQKVVAHFFKEKYSTEVVLEIDHIENHLETMRCLTIIHSRFPRIIGLLLKDPRLNAAQLGHFFSALPEVQVLSLSGLSDIKESEYLTLPYPSQLKEIILEKLKIKTRGVEAIFSRCTQLESFKARDCLQLSFDDLQVTSLPPLKTVQLVKTRLSDEGLIKLSEKLTHLGQLELINNPCLSRDVKVSKECLDGLKVVKLGGTSQCFSLVRQLTEAPVLTSLELLSGPSNYLSLPYRQLRLSPTLTELKITYSSIDVGQLNYLLEQAPKLCSLSLRNCYGLHASDFEAINYPETLEKMEVVNCAIGLKGLNQLCLRAQNVASVTLKECSKLSTDFLNRPLTGHDLNTLLHAYWNEEAPQKPTLKTSSDELFFDMDE